MKYIITEDQLERIKDDILTIPYSHFNNDWDLLQKFLNKRGNPPYILRGNLNLRMRQDITSLGSLIEVTGYLDLFDTEIKNLGNLKSVGFSLHLGSTPIISLGNLTHVGDFLNLYDTPIEYLGNLTHVGGTLDFSQSAVEDLGNLTYVGTDIIASDAYITDLGKLKFVGRFLDLGGTPVSKKYTKKEIRDMVKVGRDIFM